VIPPQATITEDDSIRIACRARALFERRLSEIRAATHRRLAVLSVGEWLVAIGAALWISPTWIDPQAWIALGLGGIIAGLPAALVHFRPDAVLTLHVVAASQMLIAGLLVHLTGGHPEAHFVYFGLLVFLSLYRDWPILFTAAAVAGGDHLLRAFLWPEPMYGISAVSLWRPLEHAGWVAFEAGLLTALIRQTRRSIFGMAWERAKLEGLGDRISAEVQRQTRELKRSEARYRAIFEDSPLPMWIYDAETLRFLAVNREAVRKYGYSEEEFLGMEATGIRPAEDEEELRNFIASAAGAAMTRDWRHRRKDGTVLEVEVASQRVRLNGRTMILELGNDVSERKRATRERKAMEVQLRHAQKLESIGQLAAGIAHEINTPAQYVGDNLHFVQESFGHIQSLIALQEGLIPQGARGAREAREAMDEADVPFLMEEIPRALEQAIEGVNRISTLVRAMKEFSHPGQKEKTPSNLNRAIESTITVARNEWKYVADMRTDFDPALPLVPCMVSDFNQVMLNLIVNAAHAISDVVKDGAKGTITVSTRQNGLFAEVSVADTGSGIPEAVRDRVFDPFFTTKNVGKGSGQGLAISRSVIVDKHGGTIGFETEPGRGTTFVIRLPLASEEVVPV
jgi:PAS domain S-box-containing protein